MATATYSEFAFHVHKKHGDAQRADLFTIAVWEESVLRAICHAQPIDNAMSAVRNFLQQIGKPVEVGQR